MADDERYLTLPPAAELFAPTAAMPDGWRVPVEGRLISYIYVGLTAIDFEIWLGGDNDLTLRLERPFTLRDRESIRRLDPRTTHKSELAPMLAVCDWTVSNFLVTSSGQLEIGFGEERRLVVEPVTDGRAWMIGWPFSGPDIVGSAAGAGPVILPSDEPWVLVEPDGSLPTTSQASLESIESDSGVQLPIRGQVALVSATSLSIELTLPIPGGGDFDIHFGGDLRMTDAGGGELQLDAASADRASLGPMLDLLGARLTESAIESPEQLHLVFADGRRLRAGPGTWEAHWPTVPGGLDEHWVPRDGPSIP